MIELSYIWMIVLAVIVFTLGFLYGWSSHNKAILRGIAVLASLDSLDSGSSKRDVK